MRALTPKQKEFAERLAKGEDPLKLTKELYFDKGFSPEGFKKWADNVIAKPQVRRHFVKTYEEMQKVGLTVSSAALRTLYIMNKPRGRDRDKLAAAEMVFRYHDKANTDPAAAAGNPIMVLIQNRIQRGLPVPDNVKLAFDTLSVPAQEENEPEEQADAPGEEPEE